MSFLIDFVLFPIASLFVILATIIIIYFKHYAFTFWDKKGLPYREPSIPAGNIGNTLIGKQSLGEIVTDLYEEFKKKGHKHAGFYFLNNPIYFPLDPDIIKHILMKDFQHFVDRGVYYDENLEPLSAHLFALEGIKWKNLRAKLSPTFTSGKMKMMFQTLVDCSEGMKIICDEAASKQEVVDIKDILARFTTDVIGSVAFGLECNSLKNPDAEFRKMGKRIFDQSVWEAVQTFVGISFPACARFFKMRMFPKTSSDFFIDAVKHTIDYREKNDMKRNDFLQLLIQLKNQGQLEGEDNSTEKSIGTNITFNEAAAQAFVFFIAGFETSSTTMTFCLFELAMNNDIQERMRQEVQKVLHESGGKLTYEGIMKMTYMEKVVQETLRKYPPVQFLNRQCTAAKYKVPGTDLELEKGTNVFIPVHGLQKDPEFYPNPDKFDPERFSDEEKAKRHPCVYLPFGEGPRICIGLRFGMMQTKVGLAVLLSRYSFSLNNRTQLPLKYLAKSFILTSEEGIWLDLQKIPNKYQVSLNVKTKLPIQYDPRAIVLTTKGGIWLNIKKI